MKKILFIVFLMLQMAVGSNAQTELIINGGFETATWYDNWGTDLPGMWGGTGSACTPNSGNKYCWCGDQNQATGLNDAEFDLYQAIDIPSDATECILYFYASINTEEVGTDVYDYLELSIKNTSGTLLESLGGITNANGDNGIPGCQTWDQYSAVIPSTYYGQTIRLYLEFYTDYSNPTIFRVDDVSVLVSTASTCTYSLSTNLFELVNNDYGVYENILLVNTQTDCLWDAEVTSGNTWLTTSSSGSGSGTISIIVLENNTPYERFGTIDVEGEALSVTQPGNLGINEQVLQELLIFPNPATDFINISYFSKTKLDFKFDIIDITGKNCYSKILFDQVGNIDSKIDISSLSQGIYMLQISGTDFMVTQKIIVE